MLNFEILQVLSYIVLFYKKSTGHVEFQNSTGPIICQLQKISIRCMTRLPV